jgi:hypothetical protein
MAVRCRAGAVTNAGVWYGPGSAKQRFARAPRCIAPGTRNAGNILSDRIGHLPDRLARSRKNPLQVPVREIRIVIETGKVLRIVTNDLDAPAEDIAELYKQRWQIEPVLPMDKANAENQTLRRHIRKRRTHSDRHRPDSLPDPAHGSGRAKSHP